ncbi:hypothetical protein DFO70_13115 [Cytobacillus firmus]|uniref:Uncharacterized protein n=3 Tax=Bacillaceae TaxID=186817 RepID=A0A366JIN7_CYTFI|nr:hypothetical protein DFO70_13115 [Cytobacillus firmus]TDX36405.1 hypothetical protein DFO72_12022 [Cytobacillus oceanisediminis]
MPLPQIIKLLEQCFEKFRERQPEGAIKVLDYCEKYITDQYKSLVAKDLAKEATKNVKPVKHNNYYQSKVRSSKPICTEMLPDWYIQGDF